MSDSAPGPSQQSQNENPRDQQPPVEVRGLLGSPPYYRIRWKEDALEPVPPLSLADWETLFAVMREQRISGLHAAGQMTDEALEQVSKHDFITYLNLAGSAAVTDAGLKHLAAMPQLATLNLSGCAITDRGLDVLSRLASLRTFSLFHHRGISDAGLAHLADCPAIERVDLLGSRAGDGVLRALAGKPNLRHLKSGTGVTDEGLAVLQEFPVFRSRQGDEPAFSLMTFAPEERHLLLRGSITDRGLERLVGLDGLCSLNLDDANLPLTAAGVDQLASLPNLCCLGFDAKDESMPAIARLPHLRMLLCQDTEASDEGFLALSASRTLEYIWGRRCYNLTSRGFSALARMPALRGIAVSCRNVEDAALGSLPSFPSLQEFMPMDVAEESFRHVGGCKGLEAVWCMYCRESGDLATEYLSGLPALKTYYAGQTRITDRSLEILGGMQTLEALTFSACAGVTDSGIAALAALPRVRELSLESMPNVTAAAFRAIPARVHLNFEP